jgi:peptide/nickel transport system permease protein
MWRFIGKRLLLVVPVIVGVTLVSFFMLYLLPGDPALYIAGPYASAESIARIRDELGLNLPLYLQFFKYIWGVLHGDFGTSVLAEEPVMQLVLPKFLNTMVLAVAAMLIAITIGVIAGVVSAVKRGTILDSAFMGVAVLGVSLPSFFTGLILLYVFSLKLRWFPAVGYNGLSSLVLPAIALSMWSWAIIARMTRTTMLEILKLDYVRTARAMGLKERMVIFKYAFKNALIPVVTAVGVQFGYALAGAVIVETVFSWPGIGSLIVDTILSRDFPTLRGGILIVALSFVLVNLATDIVCFFINPRLKHT